MTNGTAIQRLAPDKIEKFKQINLTTGRRVEPVSLDKTNVLLLQTLSVNNIPSK